MNVPCNRTLFWAPRVLCILFIAFVSLFALDAFEESHGFRQIVVDLTIHLIPTLVMVAALVAAWRWEWVGTVTFTLCGVFFTGIVRGSWFLAVLFVLPCFLIACLFFVNWLKRKGHPGAANGGVL